MGATVGKFLIVVSIWTIRLYRTVQIYLVKKIKTFLSLPLPSMPPSPLPTPTPVCILSLSYAHTLRPRLPPRYGHTLHCPLRPYLRPLLSPCPRWHSSSRPSLADTLLTAPMPLRTTKALAMAEEHWDDGCRGLWWRRQRSRRQWEGKEEIFIFLRK